MPPKRNRNAKRGAKAAEEPEVVEKHESDSEEVQYDSDGNEIEKPAPSPEAATSSAGPAKLTAREIQKLKKKKQKGLLSEEELAKYADVLGVEERYDIHTHN